MEGDAMKSEGEIFLRNKWVENLSQYSWKFTWKQKKSSLTFIHGVVFLLSFFYFIFFKFPLGEETES